MTDRNARPWEGDKEFDAASDNDKLRMIRRRVGPVVSASQPAHIQACWVAWLVHKAEPFITTKGQKA
jgi:hypothetical protein